MLLARKADAKIADERPGAWHVERLGDRLRIEDRHPADAEAAGARGEPECVQGANGRIAARLAHGARAEAMALLGRLVTEDRELDRRVVEARELEPGVERRPLADIGAERVPIGRLEIGADGSTASRVVDTHEPGRLAIADRRRERGEVEQFGQHRLIRRFARTEMAHVAPPGQKIGEVARNGGVELGAS